MESRNAAPKAASDYRRFPERPDADFIASVKDHIARTGQPETYPGLYQGDISKDEAFFILAMIEASPRLRPDGSRAPCPMCRSANKFVDGRLVYLPRLQAAAVIGNACASHDTNKEAKAEWDAREARRVEEAYLLRAASLAETRFSTVGRAAAACREADAFLRAFRSEGKPFFDALAKARSLGGELTVTEEIKSSGVGPRGLRASGSNIETRDLRIGALRGQTAVSRSFAPAAALESVVEALRPLLGLDGDAAQGYVSGLSDKERSTAVKKLRNAERSFSSLIDSVRDMVFFFEGRNIGTINEWAGHDFSVSKFHVTIGPPQRDGRRRFEAKGSGRYFQHLIGPALWDDLSRLSIASEY